MSIRVLALVAALALVLGACDRREVPENQPDGEPTAQGVDPSTLPSDMEVTPPAATTGDDSIALGLLGAVNEHEIAAAKQAVAKGVKGKVLDYANMMDKQHSENLAQTQALGMLVDDAEVQALKAKGAAELAELGKLEGQAYQDAYVEAMIKGHTEVLALIDSRMLTLAKSEAVKSHLTATREHIAEHLAAAQALK